MADRRIDKYVQPCPRPEVSPQFPSDNTRANKLPMQSPKLKPRRTSYTRPKPGLSIRHSSVSPPSRNLHDGHPPHGRARATAVGYTSLCHGR